NDTQTLSAGGRTVIPGLNDSHLHPTRGGRFYAAELRWDGVGSLEEGLNRVAEAARNTPSDQWVRVIGGWSPYQFRERRLPTPAELTRAAPDTPVYVLYLYSQGYLNAAAVRKLGLTPETEMPPGTGYEFTEDGGAIIKATPNPDLLYGTIGALPPMSDADQLLSTKHFYRELNRFGMTSVIDAGGGGHKFPDNYGSTENLAEAGDLPIRISNYLFPQDKDAELTEFETWTNNWAAGVNRANGLENGYVIEGGGEFLAWAAGDYENFLAARPDITERPNWRTQLRDVTAHLLQRQWPLRIHATYDQSINKIMDVFEEVDRSERRAGRAGFAGIRWAFDHGETVRRPTLARVKRLGGGFAMQARMAYAGEYFLERYGEEAARNAPPLRDVIAAGIPLGLGSDGTRVASYNPWNTLYWATTGKSIGGTQLHGARHQLTRQEALFHHTVGSAWFSQEDTVKGRIAVGQYADLAILSEDYFAVPDEGIKHVESVMTVTGGNIVYGTDEFAALVPQLPAIQPEWSPVATFGGFQARN
ncbi:MAG: amidohydrolase, partial [Alteraurantiacibacter sp.]